MGRRTRRILPLGMVETCAYDPAGNLTNRTDFNGHTTIYTYDNFNRLKAKVPDLVFAMVPVTFNYNALGQRTNMTDASGATAYQYDGRGRLVHKAITVNVPGLAAPFTTALHYTYDPPGNLTNLASMSL